MKLRTITTLILILITTSCSTYESGTPRITNNSFINKIERGVTTKSQIRNWFGEPAGKGYKDGKEKWLYNYNYTNSNFIPFVSLFTKTEIKIYRLELFFNPDTDRVTEYEFINNSPN